ncbi:cysteine hydrolase [Pseudonocardia sp. 73-21]|uniref:cysteine hydrolase family protein n=1 Tax=Pseudonocardia sp. 73-21 TaxID=1895809 RepID=UPI000958F649|nr:cysteine hydrolase [Pseudonocardia sp. 73-21]OJY40098.1 MAG: hydrolase [Pseudonocardia sp. 73-21]
MTAYLAVIDMQRVFGEPSSPWATPGYAAIVPAVQALVAAFGDAVTFTRFVAPAQPQGAWAEYYAQWPFALQPPDAALWDLTSGLAGPTVDATTFGKWEVLTDRVGDATLVLCGVSTDCCVLSTALAAADAGVRVQVVADACAGVDEASHRKTLDVLALYGPLVEVVSSEDVL